MDLHSLRRRLQGLSRWLDATPAEIAGLAVLVLGGVLVLVVLAWLSVPRPARLAAAPVAATPEPAAGVHLSADTVTVHVAGAVVRPGLVVVDASARVADAIQTAGGPTVSAALDSLNLARPVVDGERIEVPRIGQAGAELNGASTAGASTADGTTVGFGAPNDSRLDLNAATAMDLQQLPGIGPVLAGRIIEYRDRNGPFTEVGLLRDVAGIGERTFQSLADLVRV